jgi:hypothetical protein
MQLRKLSSSHRPIYNSLGVVYYRLRAIHRIRYQIFQTGNFLTGIQIYIIKNRWKL